MRKLLIKPTHIGEIMKDIIPTEIVTILKKLEKFKRAGGSPLTDLETEKLHTFLCGLETAVINPVNGKECLVNPIPNEPDLTITREETMIDRIRHINSVSARVREAEGHTTKEMIEEFESIDMDALDDHPVPRSIFQVADHEIQQMEPDELTPTTEKVVPNPDLDSEADVIPPEADNASAQE